LWVQITQLLLSSYSFYRYFLSFTSKYSPQNFLLK